MKQVLVHKGKHDDKIYDYSSRDMQKRSLKRLFKDLKEYEYYYRISDESSLKESQKQLAEVEVDLSSLFKIEAKSQTLRVAIDDLKKEKRALEDDIANLKEQRELYKLANKGDVKAIYSLLHKRRDLQYEGFSVVYMD